MINLEVYKINIIIYLEDFMSILSIILTAIGLAMDAFAVSLTIGMSVSKDEKSKVAIKSGIYFGLFQGIMPLIGWVLGIKFTKYIQSIDHWVAFILLSIIGLKMIHDGIKDNDKDEVNEYSNKTFIILAVATSIDALAIGVTFAFLNINIVSAVIIIGVITFILSMSAVYLGKIIGNIIKNKAGIFGGVILIIMALKILLEHLGVLKI